MIHHPEVLARFRDFIIEREAVRLRKESGALPPWTLNPILAKYRFTNVRRMDDLVSRWLMDNWYRPHFDHPAMLPAVALARFFNKPQTLQQITPYVFYKKNSMRGIEWGSIIKTVRDIKSMGLKVFNAAYIVSGGGGGADKIESVVTMFSRPLANLKLDTSNMKNTHETLCSSFGIGSFMGGQIVADLRWAMKGTWEDRYQWAPKGPGSARGISRILYGPDWLAQSNKMNQGKFIEALGWLMAECTPALPTEITGRMEAMDWQNCLCELDKTERMYNGEGRPKQLYRSKA